MRINKDKTKFKRLDIILYTFILLFILLSLKLLYIQAVKGKEYCDKAIRQSKIKVDLTSNRGYIYDRNNVLLTDKEEQRIVVILKRNFKLDEEKLKLLESVTKMSEKDIYKEFQTKNNLIELKIKSLDEKRKKEIENQSSIMIVNKKYRYLKENLLSHVIGYTKKYENEGLSGIEKAKNEILKDQKKEYVEAFVDARKNVVPGSFKKYRDENMKAKNIKTTIDFNIQKIAEKALDKKKSNGAIVISDVNSGEILSIVSRPNFDPSKIENYINSKNQELLNKAIQCTYSPGSIFKIVVALAAFEEDAVDENEKFNCNGKIDLYGMTIRCWKRDGHGEETFKEAFYNSCNPVFVEIAKRIGSKKILDMAKKMELEGSIGIGLKEEKRTLLPSGEEIKGNAIGNIAIGQGDIEVTPIQINQMTQIIANNGVLVKLRLFDSVLNEDMKTIEKYEKPQEKVVVSPFVVNKVRKLMEGVVDEGTASIAKDIKGGSAGKTGSAESYIKGKKLVHGWFTGYYPKIQPKYAITVFIYDGKSGAGAAVPVFKDIIENINNIK